MASTESCREFLRSLPLRSDALPLEPRLDCIRAIYQVFADIVATLPPEVEFGVGWTSWDHICWNFRLAMDHRMKRPKGNYYELLQPNDRTLSDCTLEAILRVLALGEIRCENGALHGLGHLNHPCGRAVVQQYIDDRRATVTSDRLPWLEASRDGTMM
jgi:hypothetical protein